jgi:hypothetical protein
MAEFLAMGDPDAAFRTKCVSSLRMQQVTSTYLAIPLTQFIFGLTMGALGHMNLPKGIRNLRKSSP